MILVSELAIVLVAGFVLFPVLLGSFFIGRISRRRSVLATSIWAIAIIGLVIAVASSELDGLSPLGSDVVAISRHFFFGVALLASVVVLQEVSGIHARVLTWMLAGLVVLRFLVWTSIELGWSRPSSLVGDMIVGPVGELAVFATNLLSVTIVIWVASRPWKLDAARRACAWSLIPMVLLLAVTFVEPSYNIDFALTVVLSLPIVIVQTTLLTAVARDYEPTRRRAERDAQLAKFAAAALTPGAVVATKAAVDLVAEQLPHCTARYRELTPDELWRLDINQPVHVKAQVDQPTITQFAVRPNGKTMALLEVVGELDSVDSAFVWGVVWTLSAALSRSALEQELREKAVHDPLTGVPNWTLLHDRISRMLAGSSGEALAIVCCDIRELQAVNNEYGHAAGDHLLIEVATRLTATAGPRATVARLSSDEFVVAALVRDDGAAGRLCQRILAITDEPVQHRDHAITFDVRLGVVSTTNSMEDPDQLIREAEIGVMQARAAGLRHATFDGAIHRAEEDRRRRRLSLASAISGGQIIVEYQAIVELGSRAVVGVEALARWQLPDGSRIPPLDFIPMAESNGLITPLTHLVFTSAIQQLREWDSHRSHSAGLRLSLNATPNAVGEPGFPRWFLDLLDSHGVEPSRMTLEITESALDGAQDLVLTNLNSLRAAGVRLSLDDFGTGYSTYERLLDIPVGEIKIDKRFTMTGEGPHRRIVTSVVELAHSSDLVVVAEGIETQEQWQMLLADGCEFGQGYLFSRPLSGDRVPDLVHRLLQAALDGSNSADTALGLNPRMSSQNPSAISQVAMSNADNKPTVET